MTRKGDSNPRRACPAGEDAPLRAAAPALQDAVSDRRASYGQAWAVGVVETSQAYGTAQFAGVLRQTADDVVPAVVSRPAIGKIRAKECTPPAWPGPTAEASSSRGRYRRGQATGPHHCSSPPIRGAGQAAAGACPQYRLLT